MRHARQIRVLQITHHSHEQRDGRRTEDYPCCRSVQEREADDCQRHGERNPRPNSTTKEPHGPTYACAERFASRFAESFLALAATEARVHAALVTPSVARSLRAAECMIGRALPLLLTLRAKAIAQTRLVLLLSRGPSSDIDDPTPTPPLPPLLLLPRDSGANARCRALR